MGARHARHGATSSCTSLQADWPGILHHCPGRHADHHGCIAGQDGSERPRNHGALIALDIGSTPFYAHGDRSTLTAELDLGRSVVVWLAMWGDINSFDAYSPDGIRYQLTQDMHVTRTYGYDEPGVYLTDPGTAVYRHDAWGDFMAMRNVMDGMGLSVHP